MKRLISIAIAVIALSPATASAQDAVLSIVGGPDA